MAAESAPASVVAKRTSESGSQSAGHWWDGFVLWRSPRRTHEVVEEKATPKVRIDGVVVVTDSAGHEHREEAGTLVPGFFEPVPEQESEPGPESTKVSDDEIAIVQPHVRRSSQSGDDVEISSGRFHVDAPEGCEFEALKLTLGGRLAVVDSEPVKIAAGQPVTIRAHWIDGVRVHVVDQATHAELDDVKVVHGTPAYWTTSPGAAPTTDRERRDLVLEHGRSPVVVPPRETKFGIDLKGYVSICARDHAWTSLEIDCADPSERTVELAASASLVVDVQGELPEGGPSANEEEDGVTTYFSGPFGERSVTGGEHAPHLRLRKPAEVNSFEDVMTQARAHYDEATPSEFPGGRKPSFEEFQKMIESMRDQIEAEIGHGDLVAERIAAVGEFRLESLEVQELVATIEVGDAHHSPLVLASAPARLEVGTTTKITLVAGKAETSAAVPLAGTIFVPDGWDPEELKLDLEPFGLKGRTSSDVHHLKARQWTRIAGRPGWYRWSAGAVRPAKYLVRVEAAGFFEMLDVVDPGDRNVEIVLPTPATLRVRLVTVADGKPAKMERLRWEYTGGSDLPIGSGSIALDYDAGSASYTGRVPAVRGTLDAEPDRSWDLEGDPPSLDVHPGEQELVVRVRPSCGVSFDLTCDGARVDWSGLSSWDVKLERLDGPKRRTVPLYRESQVALAVGNAGRYRVTFPDLDGYEAVAPFEVEVVAGEFEKKTIELRKKK